MFTHDPRSAKASKGFESPSLQGRVNSPGSFIFAGVTKIVFLGLESVPLTSRFIEHQDIIAKFCGPSQWKELSKETSSKILPCGDGSCWKTFKPVASLIAKGKLK
nr:hypothetical protein [Tanacetum cinerariifolium]